MTEPKVQLGPGTWAYVDEERSKLIVEMDIPKSEEDKRNYNNQLRGDCAEVEQSSPLN